MPAPYPYTTLTGGSGIGVRRLNLRPEIGGSPPPSTCAPYCFFRRRRRVSIYITYTYRPLETRKYSYHLNARLQIKFKRRLKANALRVKKIKRGRGANPQPVVLIASAFPLPHGNLQCFVQFRNHIIAERRKIQQVGSV